MKADLVQLLTADAGVAALIADRCAWGARSQDEATPGIALHLISDAPDYHLTGASGFEPVRVQVNCYGSTYLAADSLASAVMAAVKAVPAPGVPFGAIRQIQIAGGRDLTEYGQADLLFLIAIDLMVN